MATTTELPRDVPAQGHFRATESFAKTGRTLPVLALTALLATGQMYTPIPMFGPMQETWGVGPGAMTWIVSAFAFGYAGGFVLFGPMSDRFGQRRVLIAGMLAAGLVTLLTAFAPAIETALILRVLQGLAVGSLPPALMAYLGTRLQPRHRAVGITTAVTGFLAATVVGQLAAQTANLYVGWQWVFIGSAAAFGLLAIALGRIMLPDCPGSGAPLRSSYAAIPGVLRIGALLPYLAAGALAMAAMVGVYTGIELTGLVTGTGELLGLRASALPVMLALPLIAIPVARLARPAQMVLGTSVAAAAMVVAALTGAHAIAVAILLAVMVGGIGLVAPAVTQVAGDTGAEHRAAASSVAMFSFYIGATIGPLIASAAARHGFEALSWTLAAMLALAAGLVLWGRRLG